MQGRQQRESSTGVKLSLQMYTRNMLSQNTRLHYLGRLAQEYALVQHSRQVRRRPQRKTGPGAEGAPREAQPIPTGAAGALREAQPSSMAPLLEIMG